MGRAARRLRRRAHRCVRPRGGRASTPSEGCSRDLSAVRPVRVARASSELRRELLISPLPELGLVAANGPNDPEPELVVEDGVVTRLDGRDAADFDVIDRFLVAHGLDLDVAAEAMALGDDELARQLVDVDVPARGARPALPRPDAGQARARRRRCSTRSS